MIRRVALAVAASAAVVLTPVAAHASTPAPCSVHAAQADGPGVTLTGTCSTPVSVAVWLAPSLSGNPIYVQHLFWSAVVSHVGPGPSYVPIILPSGDQSYCFVQVDVAYGGPQIPYGPRLIAAWHTGSVDCLTRDTPTTPPPTEPPTTPPPTEPPTTPPPTEPPTTAPPSSLTPSSTPPVTTPPPTTTTSVVVPSSPLPPNPTTTISTTPPPRRHVTHSPSPRPSPTPTRSKPPTPAPTTSPPPTLPFTGAPVHLLVLVGSLLAAIGIGAVGTAIRLRR